MTAEIAIMNKEGIALAADSAVTMGQEKKQKIFTSANKIFTLSKYYPVGIMVYGSANFMEVPWETIIKIYRSTLGKQKFDTLKEHADNFIAFLNDGNPLFSEDLQKDYLYRTTWNYFNYSIKQPIKEKVKSIVNTRKKINDAQIKQIISDVIRKRHDYFQKIKKLPSIPKTHIRNVIKKYGDVIDKVREEVFEQLPISPGSLNQLRKISASLFSKDVFPTNISGVVIAGFGEKETFPSLKSFDIQGIVNDKLKYKYDENLSVEISFRKIATIIPFAQKEMVYTFMEGVDPGLEKYIMDHLSLLFDKYPEIIIKNIEGFDAKKKRTLLRKLKKVSTGIFNEYQQHLTKYRKDNYVNPVTKIVAGLPKKELATMAESFVSLTSFKRKVTPQAETVAGPIDVAVISKGDGFIWIKRKHYFEPELNPQFSANYYREVKDENK